MFVTGLSVSKFGYSPLPLPAMMLGSLQAALQDSGLELSELEAIYISNNLSQQTHHQSHLSAILSGYLPGKFLPIFNLEAACGSGGAAMHQACLALKTYARIAVLGVEKMTTTSSSELLDMVATDADCELDQREGIIFPAAGALLATRYLQKYSATTDDLAQVALKNHHNGNLNPDAMFYDKTVTLDQIKASRVICSPLRLFDCSANADGAACVILERQQRGPRSIRIAASTFATNHLNFAQDKDPTNRLEIQHCVKQAYQQANLQPNQIQVAELHDGFTVVELVAMENAGLCPMGKAFAWTQDGKTQLTGQLPINPSGGLKACGHPLGATGVRQVAEIARQLRGEGGARQVAKNKIGLALNIGSLVGSCSVHILRND